MSNFLFAEMRNNSFMCRTNLSILGFSFRSINFKLDTGCSFSTIPFHRLKNDDFVCSELKKKDILDSIESKTSYGVESGGVKHDKPETFEEMMDCTALKFKHRLTNFVLGGYKLPDLDIFVNYDRHGNILIGMDILSKFDIHIGTSLLTGKETFIAVLKSQDDKSDYYNALKEHFNLVETNSLVAEGFRNLLTDFKKPESSG